MKLKMRNETITDEAEAPHVHDWRIYQLVHESRFGDFYRCEYCGERQFRVSRSIRG